MTFDVNNGRILSMTQEEHDGWVTVHICNAEGKKEYGYKIDAPDFVMLWNFYRYIKENDINHDFINPNGKEVE